MKTLKITSIIVLVAISLGFVDIFAEMRGAKVKSNQATAKMTLVPKKTRIDSEQSLRTVLTDVLNNASIYESGKVNIVFKVTGKKLVEVMNIYGGNPGLVSSVKYAIARTVIVVPEAIEGKYIISVVF